MVLTIRESLIRSPVADQSRKRRVELCDALHTIELNFQYWSLKPPRVPSTALRQLLNHTPNRIRNLWIKSSFVLSFFGFNSSTLRFIYVTHPVCICPDLRTTDVSRSVVWKCMTSSRYQRFILVGIKCFQFYTASHYYKYNTTLVAIPNVEPKRLSPVLKANLTS